jgi:uncharacterized protein
VDPARQAPDLGQLITAFAERVPELLHALVVSSDGVPLATSGRLQPDDLEQLSAITSGLVSLAGGAARILECGALIQALVAMERGTLVIMAIDEGVSLAVLTAAADLDQVAYDMTMLVEHLAGILGAAGRPADGGSASTA